MNLTDLQIELDGITFTITSYTRNPYVVGYLKSLRKYIEEENVILVKACISKLLDWYLKNYTTIMSSEYVFNKNDHIITKDLLQNTLKSLS